MPSVNFFFAPPLHVTFFDFLCGRFISSHWLCCVQRILHCFLNQLSGWVIGIICVDYLLGGLWGGVIVVTILWFSVSFHSIHTVILNYHKILFCTFWFKCRVQDNTFRLSLQLIDGCLTLILVYLFAVNRQVDFPFTPFQFLPLCKKIISSCSSDRYMGN